MTSSKGSLRYVASGANPYRAGPTPKTTSHME